MSSASLPGIAHHLRYVGMTDADIAALRNIRALVEKHADAFVARFYAHLISFEGTKKFLTDGRVVERLLKAQRAYLLSLFDACFDDAYYAHRRTIGQTHFRIGLDFQWYIGAYTLYLEFFIPLAQEQFPLDPARLNAVRSAMNKATLLDMSIVLEAYHEGDKSALAESKAQVLHQEKLASVGLLASGLAHEVGNPLAAIQAVCDNQLRKVADPHTAEKFKRIHEQAGRIASIVRQLVDFARPGPYKLSPVNVNDTLLSALAMARLARSTKSIRVNTDLAVKLSAIQGNKDELSQLFVNLVVNAIDALPETGGVLSISSHNDGASVHVEVADNGSGIPGEHLHKLFTPFFTTKDLGKGTGLGLHVSDGIIKRHGGRINVRSAPGQGSVFSVDLPIKREEQAGRSVQTEGNNP